MGKTTNLGLYTTGDYETSKTFLDYRRELSGTNADSNMNKIDLAYGTLQARVDMIVAPDGTVDGASALEIEDARIGADSKTYSSLGKAIRDQITDLKSDVEDKYDWLDDTKMSGNVFKTQLTPIEKVVEKYWDGSEFVEGRYYTAYKYEVEGLKYLEITGVQPGPNMLLARMYDINDIEIGSTRYSVPIASGNMTQIVKLPDNSSYIWVNTFSSNNEPTYDLSYDTNPVHLIEPLEERVFEIESNRMYGVFEYETLDPVQIEDGKVWTGELKDHGDTGTSYENYCAYRYSVTGGQNVRITSVQPSNIVLAARFYDVNDNEIDNTLHTVETSSGRKIVIMRTPENCEYVWINTLKVIGGGIEKVVGCNTDPTFVGKALKIEKNDSGFYVTSGSIKLYFKLNGANNIFNLYAGWYNKTNLFATQTDWFGPYRLSKDDGSSDFDTLYTTGGNHAIAIDDEASIYTGWTVSFVGYCDGIELFENGIYAADKFEMVWHNEILAGNDIKIDGSNTPFLDEYYHVVVEPGMVIKVNQHFIPRDNGQLIWYSGLQFAGGSFAPNLFIPSYSNKLVTTSQIGSITIPEKQVSFMRAVGDLVSLDMEIDRAFDLGTNNKKAQVTGNSSKAYLTLQNSSDSPLTLKKNNIYSWRGSYRFFRSY